MRRLLHTWMMRAGLLFLSATTIALGAEARQRPIEEFVDAQGRVAIPGPPGGLTEPPIGNILAWMKWLPSDDCATTPGLRRAAKVDFAALADRYLASKGLPTFGTSYDGSITERPVEGGAIVSVRLHTRNAPAWVRENPWMDANCDGFYSTGDSIGATAWVFGSNAAQLAAGASPSLVDAEFHLVFFSPAMGAPMPDLVQFSIDPVYLNKRIYISIAAHGDGLLAAGAPLAGLGEPGDPAALVIRQVGLLETYANLPDAADQPQGHEGIWSNAGYPAEVVEIKPIGGP